MVSYKETCANKLVGFRTSCVQSHMRLGKFFVGHVSLIWLFTLFNTCFIYYFVFISMRHENCKTCDRCPADCVLPMLRLESFLPAVSTIRSQFPQIVQTSPHFFLREFQCLPARELDRKSTTHSALDRFRHYHYAYPERRQKLRRHFKNRAPQRNSSWRVEVSWYDVVCS